MPLCVVGVRRHNLFMTELLGAIGTAVSDAGYEVEFAFDEFPAKELGWSYLVIPHEFYGRPGEVTLPAAEQRARTIALCTENPGTPWFEASSALLPRFGAAVGINQQSVRELRQRGIACEHFQLGYSTWFGSWDGELSERPIDVLYLGARDERRDQLLAGIGSRLWHRRCEFLIPALEARGCPAVNYLTGAAKHERLGSAQLLLNLHRGESVCLEWMRYLEAVSNGCVFVTEPCADHVPLIPGEHLVCGTTNSLPAIIEAVLDDPEVLNRIRSQALTFIREQLNMDRGVARLIAMAEKCGTRAPTGQAQSLGDLESSLVPQEAAAQPTQPGSITLRDVIIQTRELGREVADLSHRVRTGSAPKTETYLTTPTFERSVPQMTVTITLHDLAREVLDALTSVAAAESETPYDLLVLDDASTDDSLAVAAGFLNDHPWLPAQLLHHSVNRGLGESRNELLRRARGEFVFILDADNGVHPPALQRLCAALRDDPAAAFAYPMIAAFRNGLPSHLISALPWSLEQLRRDNFIDAMALLRRERILSLGGYTTDPRLTGWEDYYLWCACAEAGEYGVHVPEVLAWYRVTEHSMLSEMRGNTGRATSVVRERFPELFSPAAGTRP